MINRDKYFFKFFNLHIIKYGKTELLYKDIEENNKIEQSFRKANDDKNDFLEKLGIVAGGEFRRISYYLNQKTDEIADLKEQLAISKTDEMCQNGEERISKIKYAFTAIQEALVEFLEYEHTSKEELYSKKESELSPTGIYFKRVLQIIDDVEGL